MGRRGGVDEVSIYALILENLVQRPEEELRALFQIFRDHFRKLASDSFVRDHEVRIRILGRTHKLPPP